MVSHCAGQAPAAGRPGLAAVQQHAALGAGAAGVKEAAGLTEAGMMGSMMHRHLVKEEAELTQEVGMQQKELDAQRARLNALLAESGAEPLVTAGGLACTGHCAAQLKVSLQPEESLVATLWSAVR